MPVACDAGRVFGALRAEHDEITLGGGEPTLEPALLEVVAAARLAGFVRVGLRSDARTLARPGVAARLVAAGLTDVLVPLHGPNAACHDYHVGEAGRFAATLGGLEAARSAGLAGAATTPLTRSNFRALGELAALLGRHGLVAWQLTVAAGIEPTSELFVRLVPRLTLALPYALHALEQARTLGLFAAVRGAPLCRVGPYSALTLPAMSRRYARACQACAARKTCPGVDPGYLAAYGEHELKALADAPPPGAALGDAARLLVEEDGCDELPAGPACAEPGLG